MDFDLLMYLLTSIEFLVLAGGIFTTSYITIWWIDTEIKKSREKSFKEGLNKGVEIGKIKSHVQK